ncbi:unnamed protein product [Rhizoctonia solani]|uniref:pectin lyase n=1 Tax=Rhizoctonia solani TaxID=456999 RepID=A0A8H3HC20_9AGAM|nr:unnamed protein product [Rhizoctonia solani]
MFVLGSLAAVLFAKGALAVGSPFGYAVGTTGGAAATQATPTSAAQLKTWLEDSGSITETGCKPWTCSPNPQLAINANNWCSADAATLSITYKKAGTSGIIVGSNKTILGKGSSGWIKGKGLRLVGSTNVIIQNIRISDLNAQFVWGGDAIGLEGASKVWIDHNYIQSIGRQFIVSHFDPNTQITISNNYFNGQSTYSTSCDQHHYWTFMFVGKADQITFARNYIYYTAGRGPKVGSTSGYTQNLHVYNNYWNDVTGHALDAGTGSRVLMEGNVFNAVRTPSTGDSTGTVFAPTSSSMNAQCSSVLGRNCVSNTLTGGSGSLANTANTAAISPFTASTVKSASVMDPSSVVSYVLANAGLGKVN